MNAATVTGLSALLGLATALIGLIIALRRKVQQISVNVDGQMSRLLEELSDLRLSTKADKVVTDAREDQLTVALEGSDTDVPRKPIPGATT